MEAFGCEPRRCEGLSRQAPHRGTAMVATAPPEGLLASETEPPWALAARRRRGGRAWWRPPSREERRESSVKRRSQPLSRAAERSPVRRPATSMTRWPPSTSQETATRERACLGGVGHEVRGGSRQGGSVEWGPGAPATAACGRVERHASRPGDLGGLGEDLFVEPRPAAYGTPPPRRTRAKTR